MQGFALCQAIGEFQRAGYCFVQAIEFAGSCFALRYWGITICKVRGDSVIFLKHAKSFVDCGSSYILNTPPHVAIPLHHVS